MKKYLILFIALISFTLATAQTSETKTKPIIDNYGKVYDVDKPDLLLKTTTKYHVIFDIYTDKSKKDGVNPLLNTVARYLNMHGQQGVLIENMSVVVIMHGAATKNVLNDEAHLKKYKINNPNSKLIQELTNSNVKIYVCGQSFIASGFNKGEKSSDVKLALSALTALVHYQSEGYQLINFN